MLVPLLGVGFGCGHGRQVAVRVVDIRDHVSERILNGQWLTEAVIGAGSGGSRSVRVALNLRLARTPQGHVRVLSSSGGRGGRPKSKLSSIAFAQASREVNAGRP